MASARRGELKAPSYELFIFLLTLLSIGNTVAIILASAVVAEAGPGRDVLILMDALITPIFFADFLYRLLSASSKRDYFLWDWGWADLVATAPMLRIFRVFRMVRVFRLIRARGPGPFVDDLVRSRTASIFLVTIFLVIVTMEVAGASIYYVEQGAETANIKSASDAVWWVIVTITTVGYGDRFPVTGAGRIVGIILLFAGIGLFSVLTGFIANLFLEPRGMMRPAPPTPEADDPRASIGRVRGLLIEQDERANGIRRELEDLERRLDQPSS